MQKSEKTINRLKLFESIYGCKSDYKSESFFAIFDLCAVADPEQVEFFVVSYLLLCRFL